MKNFYEELKMNIEKHIESNDFFKAIALIEEELSMPYIPMELEEFLNDKMSLIKSSLFTEQNKVDIEKIIDVLKEPINSIDKFELSFNLTDYNLIKYLDEIKKLLVLDDKILNPMTKKNILSMLLEQGSKDILKYTEAGKEVTIDLSQIKHFKDDKEFILLSSKIQELLFKNVVALEMALNILEATFAKNMFDSKPIDFKNADLGISLLSLKLVGAEDEIQEILKNTDVDLEEIISKIEAFSNN